MFGAGRDAGAYRNREGESPVAPTACPTTLRHVPTSVVMGKTFEHSNR